MKLQLQLGETHHDLEIPQLQRLMRFTIDGRAVEADALEVEPGIYSIRIDGKSFEVRVEPFAGALRAWSSGREYSRLGSRSTQMGEESGIGGVIRKAGRM